MGRDARAGIAMAATKKGAVEETAAVVVVSYQCAAKIHV
jgi:hypothetical protein